MMDMHPAYVEGDVAKSPKHDDDLKLAGNLKLVENEAGATDSCWDVADLLVPE